MIKCVWFLVAICLSFFLARPGWAFIQIEPTSLKLTLEKQDTYSGQIIITNTNDQERVLQIEPEYWYQGTCQKKIADWLTFQPKLLIVAAHTKASVKIQLQMPDDIRGECMVMIFFAQEAIGKEFSIQPRVGIPLYVRLKQSEKLQAKIEDFKPAPKMDQASGQSFVIKVKNTGNTHLLPFGMAVLTSNHSQQRFQTEFKFQEPIFPGRTLETPIVFSTFIPKGKYKVSLQLILNNLYRSSKDLGQLQVLNHQCSVKVDESAMPLPQK